MSITEKMKSRLALVLAFLIAAFPAAVSAADGSLYTNPETGYEIFIDDSAELLSAEEETRLIEEMKPVTQYGGAAFVSVSTNYSSSSSFAQSEYRTYFSRNSGFLFLIDMDNREIYIFCDGAIYRTITKAYSNTITDNIYRYATNGDYYECAAQAYQQAAKLLAGGKVAQPMKIICNALIALTLGFLGTFIVLLMSRRTQTGTLRQAGPRITATLLGTELLRQHVIVISSDSSSGGSSGGGGGGGGGGGSSGGGGGHGF